ncbi:MAG: ABC transporter ATP-binding protein [Planctomycetes bacterium]|nr:ABC transporter ATP-binding protein [Planctomycetota bacterium]
MSDIIIQAKNTGKEFPSGDSKLAVLKEISFQIRKGEIFSIVGPSGAGKSTLLHLMGLLDKPTAGKILFKEQDTALFSASQAAFLRNTTFGFVFQFYHLIPELTVVENAVLPFMIKHSYFSWFINKSGLYKRAYDLLEKLGLGARLNHRANQLSGGESQRVAIARALITEPEIIFCDEPTGNLDQTTSQEIQALIWEMNKNSGQTFVIVTHDENIAKKAHRMIRLVDGKIVPVENPIKQCD